MEEALKKQKGKNAFTLAEVLITLGVIGVVAAMTIPAVISNYEKKQTAAQLQKIYSLLVQAHKNAELELGPSSTWDPPTIAWDTVAGNNWWRNNFIPYANLSRIKMCTDANKSECTPGYKDLNSNTLTSYGAFTYYVLKDGTMLCFMYVSNTDGWIWVDLNGSKPPNTMGKDIFFLIDSYKAGKLVFYGYQASRSYILSTADANCCNKASRGYDCGALIQMDGWEIKDDYPWD